jgi:hypothetical protein
MSNNRHIKSGRYYLLTSGNVMMLFLSGALFGALLTLAVRVSLP